MKRLESQESIARRERTRKIWLGVLLMIIMLGSTAGYAASFLTSSQTDSITIDSDVYFDGQSWIVNRGQYQFAFNYGPNETSDVPTSVSFTTIDYQGKPLFISGAENGAYEDITKVLGIYVLRVQPACYGTCENHDLPEKDCSENMIVLNMSAPNQVYQQGNCVFIDGDLRATDAFLYKILGLR